MGISQQIGASSLIKPGVIDNTAARPASPYEGQVIFQKDTDQLLVWNGTTWVIPNQTTQNPEGLELVKSQTIGTTVSSETVTGAFSTDYDAYKIVITGGNTSADCELRMQLGSATTTYYSSIVGVTSANAVTSTRRNNTVAYFDFVGTGSTNMMSANIEIINPFLAKTKTLTASNILPTANMSVSTGYMDSLSSFTAFTISPSTGTMTGGIIRVYGYRK